MEVIHKLGDLNIKKTINENAGFMLANKNGSYCSFFSEPSSRYQGLFYFDASKNSMFKFIESLEIVHGNETKALKNKFYSAERKKSGAVEVFLMPKGYNSLIYSLDEECEVDLILDVKNSYDNRSFGRYYDIFEEHGAIIVKFTKRTSRNEDASEGFEEFVLYLALKFDVNDYKKNDFWVKRKYSDDKSRNSEPFVRHVYNALRLKGKNFVFTMGNSKEDAIKECSYIFDNLDMVTKQEKDYFTGKITENNFVQKILNDQKIKNDVKIAYVSAFNSLNNLSVENRGFFAGLPWFFQHWTRDTLISLKALGEISEPIAQKIIIDFLKQINDDGRLPNIIGSHQSNADSHGWLFLRCREMIKRIKSMNTSENDLHKSSKLNSVLKQIEHEHLAKQIYPKISNIVVGALSKSAAGLIKNHTGDYFEFNNPKETWMDTDYGNDARQGARIEIQALRLNMCRLMFELTQNNYYKNLEFELKNKVVEKFWDGKLLADGLDDFTIRPNVFIAAYAYPELLISTDWETCIENSLKNLWLEWGGLSTIDKSHHLFTGSSTGEDKKSYHRGDSWFWINNLAALVMHRINKNKFEKYIDKILEASSHEILWKGCVGCHAELSSARQLSSEGCWNQAWSSALYTEMVGEIYSNQD